MDQVAVSVVIPTYNREKLIGRAIRSALAAIDAGDEIIVVDDGSTDATEARVREFGEKVRYVRTANGGASRARNRGIAEARRPLVGFLDSDDEWMADKLVLQKQVMQHWPDAVFCCGEFGARMADGSEHHDWLRSWTHEDRPWEELFGPAVKFSSFGKLPPGRSDFEVFLSTMYRNMLHECYLATNTVLVRRELAGDALHFPEDQPCFEDWECFGRLAKVGPGVFMNCTMSWQWEHSAPRLTDMPDYRRAVCRARMIDRVWARDQQFMKEFPGAVEQEQASVHLLLARRALIEGRRADAKASLAKSGHTLQANIYRMLASLPTPVYQGMRAVGRLVRR